MSLYGAQHTLLGEVGLRMLAQSVPCYRVATPDRLARALAAIMPTGEPTVKEMLRFGVSRARSAYADSLAAQYGVERRAATAPASN